MVNLREFPFKEVYCLGGWPIMIPILRFRATKPKGFLSISPFFEEIFVFSLLFTRFFSHHPKTVGFLAGIWEPRMEAGPPLRRDDLLAHWKASAGPSGPSPTLRREVTLEAGLRGFLGTRNTEKKM